MSGNQPTQLIFSEGNRDDYNRRKVYLCTGLVDLLPDTSITKMEGHEDEEHEEDEEERTGRGDEGRTEGMAR